MSEEFDRLTALAAAAESAADFVNAAILFAEAAKSCPTHPSAYVAIEAAERCRELATARDWYGDRIPDHHAAGILGTFGAGRPYVHHVLCGKAAYETFHVSHYLADLLRHREYRGIVQPTFLMLYLAMQASSSSRVEFSEIGASLYAAYEKLQNAAEAASTSGVICHPLSIDHICVEMSGKLRYLAEALHSNIPLHSYASWRDVPSPAFERFAYSLGVGNYAFASYSEFAQWIGQNHVTAIRERFCTGADFTHHIMGKRFTFFDLDALARRLAEEGYKIVCSVHETAPFLDDGDARPPSNAVFFDAHVLVHRLATDQIEALARMLDQCDADSRPPFGDAAPPAVISSTMLRAATPLDRALASVDWRRQYQKPRPSETAHEPTMDFSATSVAEQLRQHIRAITTAYTQSPRSGA
jgi:hypothetical protein